MGAKMGQEKFAHLKKEKEKKKKEKEIKAFVSWRLKFFMSDTFFAFLSAIIELGKFPSKNSPSRTFFL